MAFALTKVLALTSARTELWKSPPLRGDASTPTLDSASGLLYVPVHLTSDYNQDDPFGLIALNATTGALKWKFIDHHPGINPGNVSVTYVGTDKLQT